MDIIDQASSYQTKQTALALANHLAKHKKTHIQSAEACLECGEAIAQARKEAVKGCQFCIRCQEIAEKGKL
jgi:phage/conjugal plasmid C-4 type zinc finger TraR family protein